MHEMKIQDPTRSPSRRFRLSLRALMAIVLLLSLGLGWIVHRARVQRQAVAAIERVGGRVLYDWQWKDLRSIANGKPRGPRWLVECLGVDYFSDVTGVSFHGSGADEVTSQFARLGRVESVVLNGSDLTDAGLSRLAGLNPRMIYFECVTTITDAGLIHLKGMTRLEKVDLYNTQIGDAGLAHLERLPRLQFLNLGQIKVTDAGMEHVGRIRGLSRLELAGTRVGDAGSAQLASLVDLKILSLDRTAVSDAGVRALRSALPKAIISP